MDFLKDGHFPSSEITLTFNAELVHNHQNKLGLKFWSTDINTMTHLRRLLELNVADYDAITHELSFLVEVRPDKTAT